MAYQNLIVEDHEAVRLIRLNRPDALNALNGALMDELTAVLDAGEADAAVRCFVITGSDRAFAAGADIKEMAPKSYADVFTEDFITRNWERVARCRKPVIAALTSPSSSTAVSSSISAPFSAFSASGRWSRIRRTAS